MIKSLPHDIPFMKTVTHQGSGLLKMGYTGDLGVLRKKKATGMRRARYHLKSELNTADLLRKENITMGGYMYRVANVLHWVDVADPNAL